MNFMDRYKREQEKRVEAAEETLRYVSGALRLMGVKKVTAAFDGEGDDGTLERAQFEPPPVAGLPEGLAWVIGNAFNELLPSGWEINAGSSGRIVLDADTGKARIDHEWRETSEDSDGDGEGR